MSIMPHHLDHLDHPDHPDQPHQADQVDLSSAGLRRNGAHAIREIELRWSAVLGRVGPGGMTGGTTGAGARQAFVLTLHAVDDEHAVLEAWLDAPHGIRSVIARQPVDWVVSHDGDLVHVDARLGDLRAVALTMVAAPDRPGRPIYARSDLLGEAGLAAGAYDPPTALLRTAEPDAATA